MSMHLTTEHQNNVRQKLTELQGATDKSSITGGDFNPSGSNGRVQRAEEQKDIVELNNTVNQVDVTDIYRLL